MNLKRVFTCLFIVFLYMAVSGHPVADNDSVLKLKTLQGATIDSKGCQSEEENMARFDKTFLENQSRSSEIYSRINESFGKIEERKTSDYPDYYGGSFTNSDGKLVIYVKGNVEDYKKVLIETAGTDDIIFKPCQFSYKNLTEIMDTINAYKFNHADSPICANFNSYAILDDENRIVIDLDEYNDEQIAAFKKQVIDSPAIEFRKATGKIVFL